VREIIRNMGDSASSLKQQSANRNVAPLGHIILILSQLVFALSPLMLRAYRRNNKYQLYSLWFSLILTSITIVITDSLMLTSITIVVTDSLILTSIAIVITDSLILTSITIVVTESLILTSITIVVILL
jgi:hypothetical protein